MAPRRRKRRFRRSSRRRAGVARWGDVGERPRTCPPSPSAYAILGSNRPTRGRGATLDCERNGPSGGCSVPLMSASSRQSDPSPARRPPPPMRGNPRPRSTRCYPQLGIGGSPRSGHEGVCRGAAFGLPLGQRGARGRRTVCRVDPRDAPLDRGGENLRASRHVSVTQRRLRLIGVSYRVLGS